MINFKKAILKDADSIPGKRKAKLVLPSIMRMSNEDKRLKKKTANPTLTMAMNSTNFDADDTNQPLTPATKAQSPTTKGSRNTTKKGSTMAA